MCRRLVLVTLVVVWVLRSRYRIRRVKSILKNLPIGNEPIDLMALYRGKNGNSDKEGDGDGEEKKREDTGEVQCGEYDICDA